MIICLLCERGMIIMQSYKKAPNNDNDALNLLVWLQLPEEIERLILQFLSFKQLAQVNTASKRWFAFYQESAKTDKEQLLLELKDPLRLIQAPFEVLKQRLAPHLHDRTPIDDKKQFFVSLKNIETVIASANTIVAVSKGADIVNALGGVQIKIKHEDMKIFLKEKFGILACINPITTSPLEKSPLEQAREIAVLSVFEKMLQNNHDDLLMLINALFENNKQQKRFSFKNNQLLVSGCGNGSFTLKNIKELAITSCLGDVSVKAFNKLVEEEEKTICKTLSLEYSEKNSNCVIS